MLGMFGIRIMSENQLLNGYANGITPNVRVLGEEAGKYTIFPTLGKWYTNKKQILN